MKKTLLVAVLAAWIASFSFAAAYGPGEDITAQTLVTQTGTVTLSSDLLSQSIFTITGYVDPGFVGCGFSKTSGFGTPFTTGTCVVANNTYRFDVTTTNTGLYPSGQLGSFYITVDWNGAFYGGSGINWNQISVAPPIDFAAIQYVATSTSIFSGTTSSSTLEAIANECADSGNIFTRALCRAFSYLFIPNPTVLNQYQSIPTDLAARFPASWFYQIQDEIDSFATSTQSAPVWSMNLHSIGIGSTTPMGNFLPDITFFSSTTIKGYFTDAQWNAGQTLLAATFWMLAFYTLYAIGHRLFIPKHNSV